MEMQQRVRYNDQWLDALQEFYQLHQETCVSWFKSASDKSLEMIYRFIGNDNELLSELYGRSNIVVLTADRYEKNILHQYVHKKNPRTTIYKKIVSLFQDNVFPCRTNVYFFNWHGYNIVHFEGNRAGSYIMGGSADIVRYALSISELNPLAVISIGACSGFSFSDHAIGETLISRAVKPYKMGDWDGLIQDSGYSMFALEKELQERIDTQIITNKNIKSIGLDVKLGNFLTGELSSYQSEAYDELQRESKRPKVDAYDPEGYGLFKECHRHEMKVPCILVKSICDWLDVPNTGNLREESFRLQAQTLKEHVRALAIRNACAITESLMESNVLGCTSIEAALHCLQAFARSSDSVSYRKLHQEISKGLKRYPLSKKREEFHNYVDFIIKLLSEDGYITLVDDRVVNKVYKLNCALLRSVD